VTAVLRAKSIALKAWNADGGQIALNAPLLGGGAAEMRTKTDARVLWNGPKPVAFAVELMAMTYDGNRWHLEPHTKATSVRRAGDEVDLTAL
jgi:hypothetical protein